MNLLRPYINYEYFIDRAVYMYIVYKNDSQ